MRFLKTAVMVTLAVGCAPQQQTKPDFDKLRARSSEAHRDLEGKSRPQTKRRKNSPSTEGEVAVQRPKQTPSMGVLRGQGVGDTRHVAVSRAIEAVSAQVMSSVRSVTTTRDFEDERSSTSSVDQQLTAETTFPFAELIRVVEAEKVGNQYEVTAELDRAEAIDALKKSLTEEARRFSREMPRIESALDTKDYAVLLSRRFSPSHFLSRQAATQRMLDGLGATSKETTFRSIQTLAKRVSKGRGAARLRLSVAGDVSDTMSQTATSIFSGLLRERGCQMTLDKSTLRSTVDVQLKLKQRHHQEFGAKWIYLGFELHAIARADGQVVLAVNGMPEFVHGGGMNEAQAEQAVLKALEEKLKKSGELFDEFICAENY